MPNDQKPIEANPTQKPDPKIASIVKKVEARKAAEAAQSKTPTINPETEKLNNQIISLKKLTMIDKLLHYGNFPKAAQRELDDAILFNRSVHKNMIDEIKKTPAGIEALLKDDPPEVKNA
jgi:hypothetical protein